MDQKILERIIKDLQSKVKCPVCEHSFNKRDIVFRGFSNGEYLFEFGCPDCSTLLYARVSIDGMVNKKISSKQSREKFVAPRKKISANDVIELHKTLEKSDFRIERYF